MLKLIYLASLMVISSLLFVFSKDGNGPICKQQAQGIIQQVSDSAGIYLAIFTDQGERLNPISLTENVVLTAGKRVNVSYNIDSSAQIPVAGIPVHIGSVTYLP